MYNETTERFQNLYELQQYSNTLLQKIREVGARKLDIEVSIDILELSITIISPEGVKINGV